MPSRPASKPPASRLPASTKAVRFNKSRASKAMAAVHPELMTPLPSTVDHSAALAAPRRKKATHNGNKNIHGVLTTDRAAKREATTPKPKLGTTRAGGDRTALDTSTYAGAELVDPNKPLTEKQKLFVRFWAAGETIPAASARAGYSDGATFAYRLVRMPNVLKMYEEEKQLYREAGQITKKKVIDMFLEAYDMAKLEADPHAMVSSARELGKICGFYEPVKKKLEISVNGELKLREMSAMSDEELAKLVYGGGSEAAEALGQELRENVEALMEDDDAEE